MGNKNSAGIPPAWVKAVEREIQKRERSKPAYAKIMREAVQDITDETIERQWNQYQFFRALLEAHYERKRFLALNYELREFVRALAAIDKGEEIFGHIEPASDQASAERRAAIAALGAVESFLSRTRRTHSVVLSSLRIHLKNVEAGAKTSGAEMPEIFEPALSAGRKPHDNFVQSLKGHFAGMAFVQMESGMSRQQAASWVALKIPSDLSDRVSSKPIRKSTVEEWMDQYGARLQIRRELKAMITPSTTVEELREFLSSRHRSRQIDGGFGQLACLQMIYFGGKCLVAGDSVPFAELFSLLREEREIPPQDAKVQRVIKDEPVRRLFASPTQLSRLYFLGELTATQVQAGELVARIYGQFERAIGLPQRLRASPHYRRPYGRSEDNNDG